LKKRSILCFLALISPLWAATQDLSINWERPITLSRQKRPLRALLKDIEKQSNVFFVFEDALVDEVEMVLPASGESLQRVLQKMLIQTKLAFQTFPPDAIVLFKVAKPPKILKPLLKETNATPFKAIPLIPPKLLTSSIPDYPVEAMDKGMEGTSNVNVLVGQDGEVLAVEMMKSSGWDLLDRAAKQFARYMEFQPARQGNKPVEIWINTDIVYRFAAPLAFPEKKMDGIVALKIALTQNDVKQHKAQLSELFDKLKDFSSCEYEWPVICINEQLKRTVAEDIYSPWELYSVSHHLGFLLFHDFLNSYSPTSHDAAVSHEIVQSLKKALKNQDAGEVPIFKMQTHFRFQKDVRSFIVQHYPALFQLVYSSEK